jgi:hypothetical protein
MGIRERIPLAHSRGLIPHRYRLHLSGAQADQCGNTRRNQKGYMTTDDLLKQATLGDWHFDGNQIRANTRISGRRANDEPIPELPRVIAQILGGRVGRDQARANGELICRAVNSFEAMREALRGLLREAPAPSKNVRKEFHYLVAREAAKKALALAEGEVEK